LSLLIIILQRDENFEYIPSVRPQPAVAVERTPLE